LVEMGARGAKKVGGEKKDGDIERRAEDPSRPKRGKNEDGRNSVKGGGLRSPEPTYEASTADRWNSKTSELQKGKKRSLG